MQMLKGDDRVVTYTNKGMLVESNVFVKGKNIEEAISNAREDQEDHQGEIVRVVFLGATEEELKRHLEKIKGIDSSNS